jgi:hypothetical protein
MVTKPVDEHQKVAERHGGVISASVEEKGLL